MLGARSKWLLHRILSIDGNRLDSNYDDNVNKKLRLVCSLFFDCNFDDDLRNNRYMLLCILRPTSNIRGSIVRYLVKCATYNN